MLGERPLQLFGFEMQKLMAGAVFVSPFLPMLFMGEEWGETNPFLYFVSHTDPELAEAVRKGRKEEFKAFHFEGEAPDPVDEQSFTDSKLQWQLLEVPEHRNLFLFYKALINLRKTHPAIHSNDRKHLKAQALPQKNLVIIERWHPAETICCMLNFSKQQQQVELPASDHGWMKIFDSASKQWEGIKEQSQNLQCAATHSVQTEPHSIQIFSTLKT
jgi:maltooligosyltrehalose trehalohydrolase